jgi:hypothetical protein
VAQVVAGSLPRVLVVYPILYRGSEPNRRWTSSAVAAAEVDYKKISAIHGILFR